MTQVLKAELKEELADCQRYGRETLSLASMARVREWRALHRETFNKNAMAAAQKGERRFYVPTRPCISFPELGRVLPFGYDIDYEQYRGILDDPREVCIVVPGGESPPCRN